MPGPRPSDSPGTSRRCQGCSHPHPQLRDQAALSFHRAAATARGEVSHPARSDSASWRTFSSTQRTTARSGGLAYRPQTSWTFSMNSGSLDSFPRLRAVRLQPERVPDPHHRVRGHPDLARHRAGRPVRRVLRRALQGLGHHPLDLLIGDRPRSARPRLIQQALEPPLRRTGRATSSPSDADPQREAISPFGNKPAEAQHDPCPQRQRLLALCRRASNSPTPTRSSAVNSSPLQKE